MQGHLPVSLAKKSGIYSYFVMQAYEILGKTEKSEKNRKKYQQIFRKNSQGIIYNAVSAVLLNVPKILENTNKNGEPVDKIIKK